MRVTAWLYNPPGRGEYQINSIDLPDEKMPTTSDEFTARSLNAVRHFWPTARLSNAQVIKRREGSTIVEGASWAVEWTLGDRVGDLKLFVEKYLSGKAFAEDVMVVAKSLEYKEETL